MKIALPITLAIGGLSLLISLLAAFMFYVDWVGQSQNQAIAAAPAPHFAELVASSQDFATLKRGCHVLAQTLDANICAAREQTQLFKRFASGIAWFAFVWGLVCGSVLLYVHFVLRRVAKNHVL
ncbi:MAG: hypothetical protein AB1722_07625 [Pseudomonadota bacterium]